MRRASGDLSLLVINKQKDVAVTASINIAGFLAVKPVARGYRYGKPEDRKQADLTPVTVTNASTAFTSTFPAYSITVLNLKRR